jgi:hypothetical protein
MENKYHTNGSSAMSSNNKNNDNKSHELLHGKDGDVSYLPAVE